MNRLHDWAVRHDVSSAAFAELMQLYHVAPVEHAAGSEAGVQSQLRIEATRFHGSLWRNNSGVMIDETGRAVRFGLANDSKKLNDVFKSSDLIGITPVHWRGRMFGVFTAVEVKAPGWKKPGNDRERAQANFGRTVEAMGGIFTFASDVDHYRSKVLTSVNNT